MVRKMSVQGNKKAKQVVSLFCFKMLRAKTNGKVTEQFTSWFYHVKSAVLKDAYTFLQTVSPAGYFDMKNGFYFLCI
jgi:hypothetical protein